MHRHGRLETTCRLLHESYHPPTPSRLIHTRGGVRDRTGCVILVSVLMRVIHLNTRSKQCRVSMQQAIKDQRQFNSVQATNGRTASSSRIISCMYITWLLIQPATIRNMNMTGPAPKLTPVKPLQDPSAPDLQSSRRVSKRNSKLRHSPTPFLSSRKSHRPGYA